MLPEFSSLWTCLSFLRSETRTPCSVFNQVWAIFCSRHQPREQISHFCDLYIASCIKPGYLEEIHRLASTIVQNQANRGREVQRGKREQQFWNLCAWRHCRKEKDLNEWELLATNACVHINCPKPYLTKLGKTCRHINEERNSCKKPCEDYAKNIYLPSGARYIT